MVHRRGVWLALFTCVACGASGSSVKKPAPEPEVRGAEGIAITTGSAEEGSAGSGGGEAAAGEKGSGEAAAGGEAAGGEARAAADESDPTVRLLDAGRGERRVLRYHPSTGATQDRTGDVQIDVTLDMGNGAETMPTARLALEGETRVTAVGAGGDVEFTSEITDVQTLSGLSDANPYTQVLHGHTTSRVISSRAKPGAGDYSQSPSADVERLFDRMTGLSGAPPPLPAEAIGVGARWEEEAHLSLQGAAIEMVTTSELTALDGTRATIRFSSSATVDARGMRGNGTGMELKNVTVSESGTYEVDLSKLVPEGMKRELHVEAGAGTDGGADLAFTMVFRIEARAK